MFLPGTEAICVSWSQPCKLALIHGPRDRCSQLLSFNRLDEIIDHSLPEERCRHICVGETGQHDHRDTGVIRSKVRDGFSSIDLRHTDVADHDVEEKPVFTGIDHLDRLLAVFRFKDFISSLLKRHLHDFANIGLVIYHKNSSLAGLSDKGSGSELTHGTLLC